MHGKPVLILGQNKAGGEFTIDPTLGALFAEAKGSCERLGITLSKNAVADMGMAFGAMTQERILALAADGDFTDQFCEILMGLACREKQKDSVILDKLMSVWRIRGQVGCLMVLVSTLHTQGTFLNPCNNETEAKEQVKFLNKLVRLGQMEAPSAGAGAQADTSASLVISGQNADSLMLYG
jgi:hypothetical protein